MHISKLSCCWCILACVTHSWLHIKVLHLIVILMHCYTTISLMLSCRWYHGSLRVRHNMRITLICNISANTHITNNSCWCNILSQCIQLIITYRLIKLYNLVCLNSLYLMWQHSQLISLYIIPLFDVIFRCTNHSCVSGFTHSIHNLLGTLIL